MRINRTTLALIIAPLVTSLLFSSLTSEFVTGNTSYGMEIFTFIVAIPISFFSSYVIGYPILINLKEKDSLSLFKIAIIGFIMGAVIMGILVAYTVIQRFGDHLYAGRVLTKGMIEMIIMAGLTASIGAFVFGIISAIAKK